MINSKIDIDKAYDDYVEQRKQEVAKQAKERIKVWQTIRNAQKKKEKNKSNE